MDRGHLYSDVVVVNADLWSCVQIVEVDSDYLLCIYSILSVCLEWSSV